MNLLVGKVVSVLSIAGGEEKQIEVKEWLQLSWCGFGHEACKLRAEGGVAEVDRVKASSINPGVSFVNSQG